MYIYLAKCGNGVGRGVRGGQVCVGLNTLVVGPVPPLVRLPEHLVKNVASVTTAEQSIVVMISCSQDKMTSLEMAHLLDALLSRITTFKDLGEC